ncbi:MAG: hypothetical protein IJ795_08055 [Bacteroidales bacterium]|nr:hypothetical protein [Bacteroidales bacterium]
MKKVFWFLFAFVALAVTACSYNDSALKEQIGDLEERVSTLESRLKTLNETTIPAIQQAIKNLQDNVFVTEVKDTDNGYVITFSNGTVATIKDGEGFSGEDGHSPEVGIVIVDGVYVWTIDGEIVTGEDGEAIPVQGNAPVFRVINGQWQVSFDGFKWEPVSVTGNPIVVKVDANGETCTITLSDGSEIVLPIEKSFSLVIEYEGDIAGTGITPNSSIALSYKVEGSEAGSDVTVDVLSTTAGISAKIVATDALSGNIVITSTDITSGKVFVYADNNHGKTNIKSITLEDGVLRAVADVKRVESNGGEIALKVSHNLPYNVNISDDAKDWIHIAATKAVEADELSIVIDENTTSSYRAGTVTVTVAATAEVVESYDIVQNPAGDVTDDLASVIALPDGEDFVLAADAPVVATSTVGAVIADANGNTVFVGTEVPVAVGDNLKITGTKVDETEFGAPALLASSVEIVSSGNETYDLDWNYIGYAPNYDNMNTGTFGLLVEEDGEYIVNSLYTKVRIAPPVQDIEDLVGKNVIVEGYSVGAIFLYEDEEGIEWYDTPMVLNNIEEVVFEETSAWQLSYSGPTTYYSYSFEAVHNEVTGDAGYYATYPGMLDFYTDDEVAEAGSVENLAIAKAAAITEEIQFWFIRYGDTIDDDATKESDDILVNPFEGYGHFTTFAIGVTEKGYPSGKYAVLEYTREDPHVAADYEDFIGSLVLDGKTVLTVSEDEEGQTYSITGFDTAVENYKVIAEYVDGKFVLSEQVIAENDGITTFLSGIMLGRYFSYPFNSETPDVLLTLSYLKDGSIEAVAGVNTKHDYSFTAFTFVNVDSASGNSTGYDSIISMPSTVEISKEEIIIDPLQVSYTSDDFTKGLTMDQLTGTSWDGYAIMQDYDSGEWLTEREYFGPLTVTDTEDNEDGDDLLEINGLSYVFGELYGVDDAVTFDLYDGIIYSHKTSREITDGDLAGNTFTVDYLTTDGDAYNINYALVGAWVADGIVALAGYSSYISSYGITFDGLSLGIYDSTGESLGSLFTLKSILMVDSSVYPTPEDADLAIRKALQKKSFNAGGKALKASRSAKVGIKAKSNAPKPVLSAEKVSAPSAMKEARPGSLKK